MYIDVIGEDYWLQISGVMLSLTRRQARQILDDRGTKPETVGEVTRYWLR